MPPQDDLPPDQEQRRATRALAPLAAALAELGGDLRCVGTSGGSASAIAALRLGGVIRPVRVYVFWRVAEPRVQLDLRLALSISFRGHEHIRVMLEEIELEGEDDLFEVVVDTERTLIVCSAHARLDDWGTPTVARSALAKLEWAGQSALQVLATFQGATASLSRTNTDGWVPTPIATPAAPRRGAPLRRRELRQLALPLPLFPLPVAPDGAEAPRQLSMGLLPTMRRARP